jgi:hypothetical protein
VLEAPPGAVHDDVYPPVHVDGRVIRTNPR